MNIARSLLKVEHMSFIWKDERWPRSLPNCQHVPCYGLILALFFVNRSREDTADMQKKYHRYKEEFTSKVSIKGVVHYYQDFSKSTNHNKFSKKSPVVNTSLQDYCLYCQMWNIGIVNFFRASTVQHCWADVQVLGIICQNVDFRFE